MVALEDSATKRLLFSEMDEIRARIIAKTPDNPCARGFKVYAETDEDGKIHMWTAPACEGVDFGFGELVGCGHMSGPFARRMWPLALMEFADRVLSRMRAPDAL
jgi:hypothetical protein